MSEPVVLGVESSCDETAAAVVVGGRDVLSNCVASQVQLHARYGGVVPEIACRAHVLAVNPMIASALEQARMGPADIDAVAVTARPGLIGSLLVGLMAAKTLAWLWDAPLIGVDHVRAHAYASALDSEPIAYPAAALVCSGGHTAIYRCDSPLEMTLLGSTIDDAAGEAFDKVASILGLGYPGGPAIDRVAKCGDCQAVKFPRSLLKGDSLDFSFSGLKTAVLYHVKGVPGSSSGPLAGDGDLTEQQIADIAASFQVAVVDVLRIKLARAAEKIGARSLILGGGVSANSALRAACQELAAQTHRPLRLPPLGYCVDNAAMVAGLAYHRLQAGRIDGLDLDAEANQRLVVAGER